MRAADFGITVIALGPQINDMVLKFVVNKDNIVENRAVALGLRVADTIIVENGIEAGERVVARDIEKLSGNQKVAPPSVQKQ